MLYALQQNALVLRGGRTRAEGSLLVPVQLCYEKVRLHASTALCAVLANE